MSDYIWLVRSDSHGNPQPGGGYGHLVRVSDNPHMHAVNQTTIHGRFPDDDCAIGAIKSALLDRGRDADAVTIEQEAGTSPQGTNWPGVINAARAQGLDPSAVQHGDPPQGFVMNPAWGGVIPPQGFWAYLAASQHMYIELRAPVVPPLPAELTEDVDMLQVVIVDGKPQVFGVDVFGDLIQFLLAGNPPSWQWVNVTAAVSNGAAPKLTAQPKTA